MLPYGKGRVGGNVNHETLFLCESEYKETLIMKHFAAGFAYVMIFAWETRQKSRK